MQNIEDQDIKNKDWFSEADISPESNPLLWQKIEINGVKDIKNGSGGEGDVGKKREDLDGKIFNLFGAADQESIRMSEEEYYVGHEIINPLVEEVSVTLQIDELGYVYEGDSIDVTYKIGDIWIILLRAIEAYHIYQGAKEGYMASLNLMEGAKAAAIPYTSHLASRNYAAAKEQGIAVAKNATMIVAIELLLDYISSEDFYNLGTKIENAGELWPNNCLLYTSDAADE